jgi:KDO2-lipid IV(A) lauroyltransferase
VLGALAALPDAAGLRFGASLGRAWARVGAPRTRDARVNLRIAFPEWSDAERERVLVASFENLGRSLVELAWVGRRDPALLAARVRVEGREHLELARAGSASGGVIVLSGHFGSWEMFAAAMSAQGLPITVVHRARDDGGLDAVVMERRELGGAHYLPRGSAALGVIKALRRGALLALLADQNARAVDGVFVPFFGRLACASAGPVRLAMSTGAPVLPAFLHRDVRDPSRHVVRIHPPLELAPGDDDAALAENARRIARALEDEIRAAPEQWAWLHRRWRTQPAGEPRPPYRLARRI